MTPMIRMVAMAIMLGVLVSGMAVYVISSPDLQTATAPPFGAAVRPAETAAATEPWPICSTMTSVASDADWVQLDADFKAGKRALRAENWNGAIAAFELAALRDPTNADIQNYIGYAYRRLRQMGPAIGHYQKALMLNARHRSAHEHLGEAYLVLGEPAKAQQLLEALETLCLLPCEEYADLQRAIAAYKTLAGN
jgi:tetratricopeptide (TPR) repeat protein